MRRGAEWKGGKEGGNGEETRGGKIKIVEGKGREEGRG